GKDDWRGGNVAAKKADRAEALPAWCCGAGYRLDWPRAAFLILALFSPRAPVRGALGAAFLRAARLTALRSDLSVMLFVFAMNVCLSSSLNLYTGLSTHVRESGH